MKKKISQAELAKKLEISRPYLTSILSGKKRPSANKARDLAEITGVGVMTWLFATPHALKKEIEGALGVKVNFGRGRLVKQLPLESVGKKITKTSCE